MLYSKEKIEASKQEALEKIKTYLEAEDVDAQFSNITGAYHSSDKFLVVHIGNWNKIPSEFSIDKCDAFYTAYSGYKAIYSTRSLFHEKQLKGYTSIELALIDVGMKLCKNAGEQAEFFQKYAVKYNERIKKQKEGAK